MESLFSHYTRCGDAGTGHDLAEVCVKRCGGAVEKRALWCPLLAHMSVPRSTSDMNLGRLVGSMMAAAERGSSNGLCPRVIASHVTPRFWMELA